MAEGPRAIVSRRPGRVYTENTGNEGSKSDMAGSELRSRASSDEPDRERTQRDARTSSSNIEGAMIPMVDLGKDLRGLFPKTMEDMGKHGTYDFFTFVPSAHHTRVMRP